MALPMWFYWISIPTPDSVVDSAAAGHAGFGTAFAFGWLVNRAEGALAAITRGWPVNLALAVAGTAWLMHIMHATPMAQPGMTKTVYALVFGVAVWAWVLGPHRRRAAFPVQLQPGAALHRGCFVLDLPRAPAGGRGAGGVGGPLAGELDAEISHSSWS